MPRRHPLDSFRLPELLDRVLPLAHSGHLFDVDLGVLGASAETADQVRARVGRLFYEEHPFEISTFSYNGSDGLEYSWAVHAPELDRDDWPMVSWAPVDDGGAAWLGDTTHRALQNLMTGRRKSWLRFEAKDSDLPDPAATQSWAALAQAIGGPASVDEARVGAGARIDAKLRPAIPEGWRFEPGPDGIGVLGPAASFGHASFDAFTYARFEQAWEEAERLAREELHAGALVLWKRLRRWNGGDADAVRGMLAAYRGLGRDMHARRAELWLENR